MSRLAASESEQSNQMKMRLKAGWKQRMWKKKTQLKPGSSSYIACQWDEANHGTCQFYLCLLVNGNVTAVQRREGGRRGWRHSNCHSEAERVYPAFFNCPQSSEPYNLWAKNKSHNLDKKTKAVIHVVTDIAIVLQGFLIWLFLYVGIFLPKPHASQLHHQKTIPTNKDFRILHISWPEDPLKVLFVLKIFI